jgi:hypothetical protein
MRRAVIGGVFGKGYLFVEGGHVRRETQVEGWVGWWRDKGERIGTQKYMYVCMYVD